MKLNKYIVITSINYPTEAIVKFSKLKDWQLIVVGDLKTPKDWKQENVIYLSVDDQQKLGFEITKLLPYNHYSRKMIGYLYAMRNGADIIADSDDDNIPGSDWGIAKNSPCFELNTNNYVNIYKYFTDSDVWPRGLPLSSVKNRSVATKLKTTDQNNVAVWQYLADEDPDVDAIYRLISNESVLFTGSNHYSLAPNTLCPINSQNTFFVKDSFPLLFLPSTVTFRFTDILRGYVIQPILWVHKLRVCFGPATVVQKRNQHDYLKDFESEIPMYLNVEKLVPAISGVISLNKGMESNLKATYIKLFEMGIVEGLEVKLIDAWNKDLLIALSSI